MTPYQVIQFEASTRGSGAHRIVCPQCGGGADKERSLSLTVDNAGQSSFRCFRASCGWSGGQRLQNVRRKEPRYLTTDTVSLSEDKERALQHAYGFVPADTVYAPLLDRFVYRVTGPEMQHRGYIARSMSGAMPKVLTFNERPEEPFIGWAFVRDEPHVGNPIVIVEDWISAEKIAASGAADAVALNGTHLTLEMVRELLEEATDQVILALDRDAYPKALKYAALYADLFSPRMRVWKLDKDLKYETFERIREGIAGNDFDFTRATDYTRSYQ